MQRLGLPELPSWQHIAWDIGAAELARGISNALDAPAVLAGYSRLIVDCNRHPDDAEAFRWHSDGWAVPANQSLTEFERRIRLACCRACQRGSAHPACGKPSIWTLGIPDAIFDP